MVIPSEALLLCKIILAILDFFPYEFVYVLSRFLKNCLNISPVSPLFLVYCLCSSFLTFNIWLAAFSLLLRTLSIVVTEITFFLSFYNHFFTDQFILQLPQSTGRWLGVSQWNWTDQRSGMNHRCVSLFQIIFKAKENAGFRETNSFQCLWNQLAAIVQVLSILTLLKCSCTASFRRYFLSSVILSQHHDNRTKPTYNLLSGSK